MLEIVPFDTNIKIVAIENDESLSHSRGAAKHEMKLQ